MPPSTTNEAVLVVEGAAMDAAVAEAKKKRRRKRRRRRRAVSEEEVAALRFVRRWACPAGQEEDEEDGEVGRRRRRQRVVVELHAHSARSDGSLSPAALVERAHRNGVKVLALTDHDTMAGVPEAMEAAREYSIRIIPGVEISAVYSPGDESGAEEPVHILAYYGSWGPAKFQELERFLASIRDGRYTRAKEMLLKLSTFGLPIEFEDVCKIAGNGVAPGRLHVARAMVEAGYVENLKQAFSRYLYDGGPAYATGSEPIAESVVQLVCRTGGIAALAHPWALKNLVPVIKNLKAAGLHAIEVYRSDGKLSGLSDLADTYELVKLGGSDYHGRNDQEEPDVGSVDLPVLAVAKFLKLAQPIWCTAIEEILANFTERAPGVEVKDVNLNGSKGFSCISSGKEFLHLCLPSPNLEEMETSEIEVIQTKLSHIILSNRGPQFNQ